MKTVWSSILQNVRFSWATYNIMIHQSPSKAFDSSWWSLVHVCYQTEGFHTIWVNLKFGLVKSVNKEKKTTLFFFVSDLSE